METLPSKVRLVAVSKTKPIESIQEAYQGGQLVFGENRVQELIQKYEILPKDIKWHLIGHLQTNKVNEVVPFVSLIHTVDSLKLLKIINTAAEKSGRVIDCLLQFHIAREETKYGMSYEDAVALLEGVDYAAMRHVHLVGVMGIATNTEDVNQVRKEFHHLREIFERLKRDYFVDVPDFKELSMGMSGDYQIAIEEGSTMIRIGSSIFGEREKMK